MGLVTPEGTQMQGVACNQHGIPVARRYSVAMIAPVFIVGVPRSGTTLVAAMLNAHPRIAITPETFFLEWALRHERADLQHADALDAFLQAYGSSPEFAALGLEVAELKRRFRDALREPSRADVPRPDFATLFRALLEAWAEHHGKPRAGEKTPRHYLYLDTLRAWFPAAPLLFVARDPRAVAASLVRVDWASDDVEEHAWRWRQAVRRTGGHTGDGRFAVTRYEDVVRRPRPELERLCAVIDEAFDPAMLSFSSAAAELVGSEQHKANVLRPLDEGSIGRWREQLTDRQVATIEEITAAEMDELGYRRETDGLGFTDRMAVRARRLADRAGGTRRRLARRQRP
jgi:hypothetical protein